MNYKKMYFSLFNEITRAIEAIESKNYGQAKEILKQAQITGEEMYIEDLEQDILTLIQP